MATLGKASPRTVSRGRRLSALARTHAVGAHVGLVPPPEAAENFAVLHPLRTTLRAVGELFDSVRVHSPPALLRAFVFGHRWDDGKKDCAQEKKCSHFHNLAVSGAFLKAGYTVEVPQSVRTIPEI